MVKGLLATLFLASAPILTTYPEKATSYREYLLYEVNERGNYTLTGIEDFFGEEFRLYHYDDLIIDEISDDAFLNTNFTTLVLTNTVKKVSKNAFLNAPSILELKYTGNQSEFSSLELTYEFQNGISYYSVDEGFINCWNDKIRPTEQSNICTDIDYQTFLEIHTLYNHLSDEDRAEVDTYVDLAGATIKASMKELTEHFAKAPKSNTTEEWNQTAAITLITIIALIGMTSITIFFLLKTKNIID